MSNLKKPISKLSRRSFYILSFVIICAIALIALVLIFQDKKPISKIKDIPKIKKIINIPKQPNIALVPIRNKDIKDPYIETRRAALIDVDSGTLLYGKNQDQRVPIASDTKIMTATIILENYDLSDVITVSKESANINGSVMGLKEGEQITTLSLVNGMLLPSGNDAALTLAEHYGKIIKPGSDQKQAVRVFIDKMNQKAKELDMSNTHYLNPAGLDDDALSTARDQGRLMAYALKNKTFSQIVHKADATVSSVDGKTVHNLSNSNRLVTQEMYFDGIIGGKTGFTPLAGHNLIVEADRDNHKLVAVIFSTYSLAPNASATQARNLLNWGYDNYTWKRIY